jgi:outer membrane immunogenic protein
MKKFWLAAGAIVALVTAAPAGAADLAVKGRPMPPPPPVFSWTGFYIGGNIGAGAAHFTALDFDGIWDFGDFSTNSIGWTGGIQGGYNYQIGGLVLGVEADINWTSFDKFRTISSCFNSSGCTFTTGGKWDWFSTLRARMGVAFDRGLAYVTAGVAWAKVQHTHNFIDFDVEDNGSTLSGVSQVKAGFTAGAGVEYAFTPNWTLKAEYLYIQLTPHETFSVPGGPEGDVLPIDFNSSAHIARLGLNYRFGGFAGYGYGGY